MDNDGYDDLFITKGNVDQMPSNAINDPNNHIVLFDQLLGNGIPAQGCGVVNCQALDISTCTPTNVLAL